MSTLYSTHLYKSKKRKVPAFSEKYAMYYCGRTKGGREALVFEGGKNPRKPNVEI
jgi:hypothetical protein